MDLWLNLTYKKMANKILNLSYIPDLDITQVTVEFTHNGEKKITTFLHDMKSNTETDFKKLVSKKNFTDKVNDSVNKKITEIDSRTPTLNTL